MLTLFLIIYNVLFPAMFILYFPFYLVKIIRRGNYKFGFWERFGIFSTLKANQLKTLRDPVWIHAVSVGETVTALLFVEEWLKREPDTQFVLSTTTSTGQKLARDRAPKNVISIYFPIDFFVCALSTLNCIKPRMIIIFEVEIWPNLIVAAYQKGIQLALVNCRMSDRSADRYRRFRRIFGKIFSMFGHICTQTEQDTRRLASIIGNEENLQTCNTMKFDLIPEHSYNDIGHVIKKVFPADSRRIFTAASTHRGEEATTIEAVETLQTEFPDLYHIIVPRHVERTAEIETILQSKRIPYQLLSKLRSNNTLPSTMVVCEHETNQAIRVLIVDTTGELMGFLHVSDVVFVGNSLGKNRGGHNMIEPAVLGKPVLLGPNMDNFRVVAQKFKENNACIEIKNARELIVALRLLLNDEARRNSLGLASQDTVARNRGAISRTLDSLKIGRVQRT